MYRQKFKALETRVRAQEEENRQLREELEKLNNQNTPKYEGINNKLSDFARQSIETAKGPMKQKELLEFLLNDVYGKRKIEALNIIRKYSNDIDGVRKQLLNILETLQVHVGYRKRQKELDDKFIKLLKTLDKTIEMEKEKEVKLGRKLMVQSTMDQYFSGCKVSYKVTHEVNFSNDQNLSKEKVSEESSANKQGMQTRKRKIEDESSSSQEDGIKHSASRSSKRIKVNISKKNTKSSDSTEFMSVDESDEPMSVEEGNQTSTQPMSISEGSSSQSDAMSVDDSTENIKHIETTKKQTGKSAKQPISRFGKDSPDYHGKEETVPERHFNLRGKHL